MATKTPELSAPPPGAVASDPVTQTMALLQPWIDYVPKRQRRLGLFIFAALMVHLAVIHFIRIDTIRAELRHQARSHVMIDTPGAVAQGGASVDHFLDRLTDPRLFILPLALLTDHSSIGPQVDFSTINENIGSQELPQPVAAEGYRFVQESLPSLEQSVQATMVPPRQPFAYEETPPPIAEETFWQWDDALAQRKPLSVPSLPSPISDTDLVPTQLRIAVDADGTVEHVLVEQSCGSERLDLDQQAVLAARKIRFKSSDQPGLLWGRVTIFWHYAPKPREEVVPTPPSST
ncbi:MAG: energy transducer TonB [Methylacidiphilales bacterium]|nr:energy transducer TonB [Candidatus Methylacidiphilales bacterium]